MSNQQPVVAILAWDGDVYLYAETLRFLAWKLARSGCKVVRFGCERALQACTSLNSTSKSELARIGRETVCDRCMAAQQRIAAQAVLNVGSTDDQRLDDARSFLIEVKHKLEGSRRVESVLDMQYAGLPVCRIAFFDFAIATKLSHQSELDTEAMGRFIAGVADQIKLLHAFERFNAKHAVTHVLYVNGNYSQNTLARLFFGAQGALCLNIEPQLTSQRTLNKVLISPERLVLEPEGLHAQVPEERSALRFSLSDGRRVLKNFGARINGGDFNAYTSLSRDAVSGEEIRRLNDFLKANARIHTFFLSSEDELRPHIQTHGALNGGHLNSPGGFASQADFTLYLLGEAAKYPEIGFVVRLHPRMAVNKRDPFESEEHRRYKQILAGRELPENVLIIYGDSKISSYYIISRSDLVIIAWSTIGLEALLLGTPVVSVFPSCLMYPLTSFARQPADQAEMHAALFRPSDFGLPDDEKLMAWLGLAFETQFIATAAPRSRGGLPGKGYRVLYRLCNRLGVYGLMAWLVDRTHLGNARFDDERLLVRKALRPLLPGLQRAAVMKSLAHYRAKHMQLLDRYGQ